MKNRERICFVIMGFGKKQDPYTNRTIDLDATYNKIIQPSVVACGYKCIRADEILDSGTIDRSMYALLYKADLVIADITTDNANALYELGTRHALRPFSTIKIVHQAHTKPSLLIPLIPANNCVKKHKQLQVYKGFQPS